MSNENLTIAEVSTIIVDINNSFSDRIYEACNSEDYFELFTVESNGSVIVVKCLGYYVWNDEDDTRSYLYDDTGEAVLNEEGEECREGLKDYLLKEFNKIVGMLNLCLGERA